jgi:hypothetical protein
MMKYHCPECGTPLALYANGDNGPQDDRWTCDSCGVEWPHSRFPLPEGYVREAKAVEKAQAHKHDQLEALRKLAEWNAWAIGL